ncbi:hypothetical protein ED407_03115 [Listeria monocytogenes]|nr:hypothetical protein [Listeria monocytogenes]EAD5322771.1 hypothetical protein [Listeria monocytogenes]EAE9197223.1 hypothetical protein [Listeria monocytogenes]EAE9206293.1 hypothetical protein [Listeria monocytogenes]
MSFDYNNLISPIFGLIGVSVGAYINNHYQAKKDRRAFDRDSNLARIKILQANNSYSAFYWDRNDGEVWQMENYKKNRNILFKNINLLDYIVIKAIIDLDNFVAAHEMKLQEGVFDDDEEEQKKEETEMIRLYKDIIFQISETMKINKKRVLKSYL